MRAALDQLVPIVQPVRAEQLARDLQRELVERGQHRAVGVADLLVAAVARATRLSCCTTTVTST
ncbi:MAG TPA: hypothetical protein VGJ13_09740 [Pseudonocardiaceae bacterium]